MIALNVEPYCKKCRHFEPECETLYTDTDVTFFVCCKRNNECRYMYNYLKKQIKDENEKACTEKK